MYLANALIQLDLLVKDLPGAKHVCKYIVGNFIFYKTLLTYFFMLDAIQLNTLIQI